MNRRQFLAGASAGLAVTAAGCTGAVPFFGDTDQYDTDDPEAVAESWALLTETLWNDPDTWLEQRANVFHSRSARMDDDIEQDIAFFRNNGSRPVEEIVNSNTVVRNPTPAQIREFLLSTASASNGRYESLSDEFIDRLGSEEIESALVDVRFRTDGSRSQTIDVRCLVAVEDGEWQVLETIQESEFS